MNISNPSRVARYFSCAILLMSIFVAGLASNRILYELYFPYLLWLGRPLPALLSATAATVFTLWLWWKKVKPVCHFFTASLLPLLLNLLYLFDSAVDLVESRFIFFASLWLAAVLLIHRAIEIKIERRVGILLLLAALLPIYLQTMPHTVGRADTFEFQVVAPQLGIAHPTGYPLYLLLGKLFTLIPFDSVAWRLNFASTVYAVAAASLLYLIVYRLLQRSTLALLAAVSLGLTNTFWSQAIEAEVYTLHALIVTAALWLMVEIDARSSDLEKGIAGSKGGPARPTYFIRYGQALAFIIGLGLTNHLTSVFLLPPTVMTLFFASYTTRESSSRVWDKFPLLTLSSLIRLLLAFLFPLLLYAYLPIRWAAINGEPMGLERFIAWVTGSRFQGALQWTAWLHDPARYEITGRLFVNNWGWINLLVAVIGFIFLLYHHRRVASILLITWSGYTFYALNYYVPDLAVFLVPAHLVIAVCWAAGVAAVLTIINKGLVTVDRRLPLAHLQFPIVNLFLLAILVTTLSLAVDYWPQVNRSGDDGLIQWGTGVLAMPLARNGAILADSEKIAPLYYLQQAEGVRPDLDIMVLPDEAAYRAELDKRLAAGQSVYLARFLPGLESIYHLRSIGPLTEVSPQPLTELPTTATPTYLSFSAIRLIGYEIEPVAAVNKTATAVTLYWQATEAIVELDYVYIRWAGQAATAQHPANNYYPTVAWDPGEIVPDYHLLPHPISNTSQRLNLQVALAPPFTPVEEFNWQTVSAVDLPATYAMEPVQPLRSQIGSLLLSGITFPAQIRPQTPLPIIITGFGAEPEKLQFSLQPAGGGVSNGRISGIDYMPAADSSHSFVYTTEQETALPNGRYQLVAQNSQSGAVCGWLAPVRRSCSLGEVEISGVPLPEEAVNFEDKIALLAVNLTDRTLQPGGQLRLTLTWQGLAPMEEDYTVFIQVLNSQDQIVGQVDTWPQQGTHPTSQWQPGEIVEDPYIVQLRHDMPPGSYRLHIGWYLLGTLRRLSILNEDGAPVDDKVVTAGLTVP